MRVTPLKMSLIYVVMGVLFISLAIETATETIWNFSTIILMLIATYDFIVATRFYKLNKRIKQNKKK